MTDLEHQLHRAQALAQVGLMASSLAHDINNLLFVLGTTLDLLEADPGRAREHATTMRHALARMSSLNSQLLTCASRSQSTEREVLDVVEAVSELLPICQRLAGRTVAVTGSFDERPCRAFIARGPFDQVVLNLVANARDAMPDGGHAGISVRRASGGDVPVVSIEVTDEGVGIAPEFHGRIFDPFFTTKPGSAGTGLGLQAVKRVIESAGGSITVSSHVGQGSTFRLLLPLVEDQEGGIG